MSENGLVPDSWLHIAAAVIVGVAGIGFLTGTRADDYAFNGDATDAALAAPADGAVNQARPYWELARAPRGKGSGFDGDLTALAAMAPAVTDPVSLDGTSKATDLAARMDRRAYDGAPPTVPHPIRQDGAPECLACHEQGLEFRGKTAPAMSHKSYASCTQCHVVSVTPMPGTVESDPRDVPNAFVGMEPPTAGPRWTGVAPPQIPHRTWMRENCDSCHGPNGKDAIRSTHPYRQSCTQCHTASEGSAR